MDMQTIFNLIELGILLLLPIIGATLYIMRLAYLKEMAILERTRELPNATYLTRLVK
tara:strand:- start:37 stop:207 length:171 start_codon:yes stop_codon:yes gene_type:complete